MRRWLLLPALVLVSGVGSSQLVSRAVDVPLRVSSGVMAGRLISQPMPVVPEEARRAHVSGSPVLRVIVDRTGHVESVTVISGPEMLRAAWVDAVRRWVYKPYLVDGVAVRVETTVTINMGFGGAAAPLCTDRLPDYVRVSSGEVAGRLISQP
jgi:TonB family protein